MNSFASELEVLYQTILKIILVLRESWGEIIAGAMIGYLVFAMFIPLDRIILTIYVGVEAVNLGTWVILAIGGMIGAAIAMINVWDESQIKI